MQRLLPELRYRNTAGPSALVSGWQWGGG
jgi:hypothetical protein